MVGQPHQNFMKMASWSSVSEHLVNPIGMSDQLKWNNHHSKNLYICLLLSVLFIVFLELLLTYKEFFDEKIIFLVIFIGLCYFYQHCKNYFLTKIKNNMVFIIISSAFLLIIAQKGYLISIAYAIVLNFFLFKLSKI